ncbi:MAG: type II toxin-antitoxin system PemK/MazF family toxin [Chloroflexi bacterium]|nr:type II toxin-antitoxin system PemK/MazF family toxin [Chloroflexota bacterium]
MLSVIARSVLRDGGNKGNAKTENNERFAVTAQRHCEERSSRRSNLITRPRLLRKVRSQRSVVVVSQVITIDKSQLGEYVGTLSAKRVRQILDGIDLITEPRDAEK